MRGIIRLSCISQQPPQRTRRSSVVALFTEADCANGSALRVLARGTALCHPQKHAALRRVAAWCSGRFPDGLEVLLEAVSLSFGAPVGLAPRTVLYRSSKRCGCLADFARYRSSCSATQQLFEGVTRLPRGRWSTYSGDSGPGARIHQQTITSWPLKPRLCASPPLPVWRRPAARLLSPLPASQPARRRGDNPRRA